MNLTIITPTFNREKNLHKLYESLKNQTNNNFEWLIIDDGSTDNTAKLIEKYIEEKKIHITYIKQENGGKHRALNNGISRIMTEMTFIVDSDDYLTADAVETIYKYYEKYKNDKNISGFCFLRCNSKGDVLNRISGENRRINYINDKVNKNSWGDNAEVFYTDVLKKYKFPEFKEEKFLSEDIVWIEMALKYDMIYIDKCIYICEYIEGGLTKSGRRIKIDSPIGMLERAKKLMYKQCSLKVNIKGVILYTVYSRFANRRQIIQDIHSLKNKILYIFLYPVSYSIFLIWKKQYNN